MRVMHQGKEDHQVQPLVGLSCFARIEVLGTDWQEFPEWSKFLAAMGAAAMSMPDGALRAVAAVTVPSRSFAAVLCACGVVLEAIHQPPRLSLEEHLRTLEALPAGTIVSFRPGRGRRRGFGRLLGVTIENGKKFIKIEKPDSGLHSFPESLADRVSPAPERNQLGGRRSRLRPILGQEALLDQLVAPEALASALTAHGDCCLVVGNKSELLDEVTQLSVRITSSPERIACGTLQDILHVRSVASVSHLRLCEVVSTRARVPPTSAPPVVVFDGARSFTRWKSVWPNAHWIVVLDRTGPGFDEAVQQLDDLYIDRDGDDPPWLLVNPPVGIECAAFTMPRR